MMANLRLVLGVDVQPGDEHKPSTVRPACGRCCIGLGGPAGRRCCGVMWRGAIEPVMSRAEQEGLTYLFRLRMTANVKRALRK